MLQLSENTSTQIIHTGRWVTAKVYARTYGLTEDTLGNWRWRDRQAGRDEAQPGFPRYRRFGRAVRYWLLAEDQGIAA
jgi:hypothetical protein